MLLAVARTKFRHSSWVISGALSRSMVTNTSRSASAALTGTVRCNLPTVPFAQGLQSRKRLPQLPVFAHRKDLGDIAALNQGFQGRLFRLESLAEGTLGGLLFGRLHARAVNSPGLVGHDSPPLYSIS